MYLRVLAAAALVVAPEPVRAQQLLVPRPDWKAVFDSAGLRGTFVIRRLGVRELQASDTARARKSFVPASTFKIPNSLIALEAKVVADENERFAYTWPRSTISDDWNRDHTFRSALKYSVLPIYQAIARKVGEQAYREWLTRLEYGNRDPGGGVDRFWLDGALRISAVEQVEFLTRFVERRLPMSERSQRIVADMLVREANSCWTIRAKTGLAGISTARAIGADQRVGWYVGWVETDSATFVFALNLDASNPRAAAARVPLTRALLARAQAIRSPVCRR